MLPSPSRWTATTACRILGISALLSTLIISGCGNHNTTNNIGPPAKVAFNVPPPNVATGSSITPAVAVSIEDVNGNVVTTATNTVTIAIQTNPSLRGHSERNIVGRGSEWGGDLFEPEY